MNKTDTKAIRCPQCGAIDVTLLTEERGKCNMCGASVAISKDEKVVNVNNEFYVQQGTDKNVSYFAVKHEFDKTEFLRKTYLDLSSDVRTPEDILESKFDVVEEACENHLLVEGDATVTYSATIGYDRKEQYKEYNSSAGKYETKTKTVTDWQPFNGAYNGTYSKTVKNDGEKYGVETYGFAYAIKTVKPENIVNIENVDFDIETPKCPNPSSVEAAKDLILDECKEEAKRSLPGDKNKDFSANGTVDVKSIDSISAPTYSINYKYNDKKIKNSAFAFGDYVRLGDTIDVSQKLMDTVNEKTKLFDIISIAAFSAITLLMLLTAICGWSKIILLAILPCIALKVFTSLNYKKLINNIVAINQENKKQELIKKLKATNFAPLTSEEEKTFIATGKKLPETKHKMRTAGTALFVIAIIFTFISLFA